MLNSLAHLVFHSLSRSSSRCSGVPFQQSHLPEHGIRNNGNVCHIDVPTVGISSRSCPIHPSPSHSACSLLCWLFCFLLHKQRVSFVRLNNFWWIIIMRQTRNYRELALRNFMSSKYTRRDGILFRSSFVYVRHALHTLYTSHNETLWCVKWRKLNAISFALSPFVCAHGVCTWNEIEMTEMVPPIGPCYCLHMNFRVNVFTFHCCCCCCWCWCCPVALLCLTKYTNLFQIIHFVAM